MDVSVLGERDHVVCWRWKSPAYPEWHCGGPLLKPDETADRARVIRIDDDVVTAVFRLVPVDEEER